jgi:hypothetical protein
LSGWLVDASYLLLKQNSCIEEEASAPSSMGHTVVVVVETPVSLAQEVLQKAQGRGGKGTKNELQAQLVSFTHLSMLYTWKLA